ncbi:amine-terminal domain cyclin (macronuclear) [Tetrahymena thermophila SB210]|uniref:Amine-terminal domain cyclin n=1 Tax=Tetrahymena thermophila (strain SB210) TaxID=312017 RepID=Q22CK1_TETTS|nr:amine-terminal domain cyclin [Tetrahymena thermophila SB210]EAR82991.2 amine-terminal domain cyclin [Tetrahymena thermophila SB210]|eukprot:XP_001030654.2 amine-terminal domain cyclin [Tetrahymena thermophila SB210]
MFWQKLDTNQKPVMQQNNINKVLQLDNQNKSKLNDQQFNCAQQKCSQPQLYNLSVKACVSNEIQSSENASTDGSSCSQNMNSADSQQSGIQSYEWIESSQTTAPVEISGQSTLQKTQSNEETFFPRVFSNNMMDVQEPTEFLKRHAITAAMRAKMIDWMIEVLKAYNFSETTFSLSVAIMDAYFANVQRSLQVDELHAIGIVSMFIASKYEEIVPFSLQKLYEKIGHEKISMQVLKQTEAEILNTLNFNISFPTLDILSNLMIKYLDSQDFFSSYTQQSKEFFNCLNAYMFKLTTLDYEQLMSKYNYKTLAVCSVFVSIQVMQQFFPYFDQFKYVLPFLDLLGMTYDQIIQPAQRILTLAKTYDKHFSSLKNLKKYNLEEINRKTSRCFKI